MAELRAIAPRVPVVANLLRPLDVSASGMSVQRRRMEAIASNIANAETTSTAEGGPYRRRVVRLAPGANGSGVRVTGMEEDARPGAVVYDPSHPDADPNGYVRYPNVDVTAEMVDLMVTRRAYEANATVFQVAKAMLRRALDI